MVKLAFLSLVLCSGLLAASPESDIRAVLDRQVADWNRGDVDSFMQGYDRSDQTLFIGKNVTRGWQQVIERYRTSYPTKEKMGQLGFSEIEVRPLGDAYALVIGRFHLTRVAENGGDASGVFSLTFHRTSDGWKIIADHTS
jgi:uncharacterized protein (TIGR02246 family)